MSTLSHSKELKSLNSTKTTEKEPLGIVFFSVSSTTALHGFLIIHPIVSFCIQARFGVYSYDQTNVGQLGRRMEKTKLKNMPVRTWPYHVTDVSSSLFTIDVLERVSSQVYHPFLHFLSLNQ